MSSPSDEKTNKPPATILTAETVPAYLSDKLDKLVDGDGNRIFSDDNDELTATPILGGNVNYAFRVTNNDSDRHVFVKQAPEFVAVFGPDGLPLTSQRMQQEMDVYAEWRSLLAPDGLEYTYLPRIYFFDPSHMAVSMEFLDGYQLMDHILVHDSMVASDDFPNQIIATKLGDFMGRVHAGTHSSVIDANRKDQFVRDFENRAMRDVQLAFVFTKCYAEESDDPNVPTDVLDKTSEAFVKEIELLKKQYNGDTDSLVLTHGDLHPGSVMVDPKTGDVKVIDPEFTVYGPPGLDVGSLLSGYCLGAIHQAYSGHADMSARIVDACQHIWDAYRSSMMEHGITDENLLRSIEVETVGFCVAEVCRTALGFAGGRKWLQFDDDAETKQKAQRAALRLVDRCMVKRHEGGIALMLKELRNSAE